MRARGRERGRRSLRKKEMEEGWSAAVVCDAAAVAAAAALVTAHAVGVGVPLFADEWWSEEKEGGEEGRKKKDVIVAALVENAHAGVAG
jgi:ABC-type sugar transport system substrate-binding protein